MARCNTVLNLWRCVGDIHAKRVARTFSAAAMLRAVWPIWVTSSEPGQRSLLWRPEARRRPSAKSRITCAAQWASYHPQPITPLKANRSQPNCKRGFIKMNMLENKSLGSIVLWISNFEIFQTCFLFKDAFYIFLGVWAFRARSNLEDKVHLGMNQCTECTFVMERALALRVRIPQPQSNPHFLC